MRTRLRFLQDVAGTFTILPLMLTFASIGFQATALAQTPRKVLVIHSYNQEFPWTKLTDQSLRETIESSGLDVEFYTEYLDTKRSDREATFREMEHAITRKRNGVEFEVVFVSDNDALDFILPRRDRLCPDVPIVFSGINRYSPELISGHRRITGVAEETEMAGTVDLVLRLHPRARMVVGISDDLTSARLHIAQFKDLAPKYHGRVEFLGLEGLSTEELLDALKKLPRDSVVLHFSFFRDKKGRRYSLRESVEIVTTNSPAPVYTLWDWKVDWGVVGGDVASGALQGKLAAQLVVRILNGESADDIPVITEQITVPMFNYPAMTRFGLTEDELPPGSVVLRRPFSFYRTYRPLILGSFVFFAIQLIIIFILVLNILSRRKAELALQRSEVKYRAIFENAIEGIFQTTWDGRFHNANPSLAHMYGYDAPDELIQSISDIGKDIYLQPEDRARFLQQVRQSDLVTGFEHQVRRKDGSTGWVSVSAMSVRDERGEPIRLDGFVIDITERKRAEEALRQKTEELDRFFTTTLDLLCVADTEGCFRRLNPQWEAVLGYPLAELEGRCFLDLIHPEDLEATVQAVARLDAQQPVLNFVNRYRCQDGSYRWFE